MTLHDFTETAAAAVESAGVVLIVVGLLLASARYLVRARDGGTRYERYRHDLGRAILLGLEVLVAADIVRTVAFTPTLDSVTVLGLIVAIRTFLSWSLALELDGRWPWQRATPRAPAAADSIPQPLAPRA